MSMTDGGRAAMTIRKLEEIVECFDEFTYGERSTYDYYTEIHRLCSEVVAIAKKRIRSIDSMPDESMMKKWFKGEIRHERNDLPDRFDKHRQTGNLRVA